MSEKEKPVPKDYVFKSFDYDFDTYFCPLLTDLHTKWYQSVIHT